MLLAEHVQQLLREFGDAPLSVRYNYSTHGRLDAHGSAQRIVALGTTGAHEVAHRVATIADEIVAAHARLHDDRHAGRFDALRPTVGDHGH